MFPSGASHGASSSSSPREKSIDLLESSPLMKDKRVSRRAKCAEVRYMTQSKNMADYEQLAWRFLFDCKLVQTHRTDCARRLQAQQLGSKHPSMSLARCHICDYLEKNESMKEFYRLSDATQYESKQTTDEEERTLDSALVKHVKLTRCNFLTSLAWKILYQLHVTLPLSGKEADTMSGYHCHQHIKPPHLFSVISLNRLLDQLLNGFDAANMEKGIRQVLDLCAKGGVSVAARSDHRTSKNEELYYVDALAI